MPLQQDSSPDLTLVVLAAGIGRRYGGLKQIDPIGPDGELIIDYSIYDALRAGFNRVVFVINEEIETLFRRNIGRRIERQCQTDYVFQELHHLPPGFDLPPDREKPWGTAHATLMAGKQVHTPFAVINADDYYGRSAYELIARHLVCAHSGCQQDRYFMVGYRLANTISAYGYVSRGICQVDSDGYLADINERTRIARVEGAIRYSENGGHTWQLLPDETIVSMNLWGFSPGFFVDLEAGFRSFLERPGIDLSKAEYFLPYVVNRLITLGQARVKVLSTEEKWFGVTYRQDRRSARHAIRDLIRLGRYPSPLWSDS